MRLEADYHFAGKVKVLLGERSGEVPVGMHEPLSFAPKRNKEACLRAEERLAHLRVELAP